MTIDELNNYPADTRVTHDRKVYNAKTGEFIAELTPNAN